MFPLQPEKYEYTVNEGEPIDIIFTSSVPVGCISSHDAIQTNCEQHFYIFNMIKDQTPISCRNNIVKRDIVFEAQFCGISIQSLHWNSEKKMRVYGVSDSMYNFKDRSSVLKISSSAVSELNEIWRDLQVPDIKVNIGQPSFDDLQFCQINKGSCYKLYLVIYINIYGKYNLCIFFISFYSDHNYRPGAST